MKAKWWWSILLWIGGVMDWISDKLGGPVPIRADEMEEYKRWYEDQARNHKEGECPQK